MIAENGVERSHVITSWTQVSVDKSLAAFSSRCCSVAEVFRDKKILFDYLDMERVDSGHNQTGTSEDLVEGNKTMLEEHVLVKNSSVILTCADQARVRTLALAAQRLGMLDTGQYVLFNLDLFGMDDIENYSPWRDEKVRAGGEVKLRLGVQCSRRVRRRMRRRGLRSSRCWW